LLTLLAVTRLVARAAAGEIPLDQPAKRTEETGATRDLSPLIAPIVERHKLPGMVAAVVQGDEPVALGAAGVRRKGSPERVTVGDRFHIGSCTKSMSATLLAMLVEEGKLSWTTTLAQTFPDLAESMHPDYRSVTLEQLLSHRAGMPKGLDRGGLWARLRLHRGRPTEARRLLLEGVVAQAPASEPGTEYLYSNAGYAAAGHMAEEVTGASWEELMRKRLFAPLGMTTAGFGAPGRGKVLDEPRGHRRSGDPVEPGPRADNPPAIGPAGTVHCSLGDWAKYIRLHLRGARGDAPMLGPATFDKLHTPRGDEPKYALGWLVVERRWGGGEVLTHAGSNTMWFAVSWLAPKRDFAVLVACNQGGDEAEKACDEAAWALIRDLLAAAPRATAGVVGGQDSG
jgi:CubicO group peptidase (beta-lactamase class C family)